MAESCSVASCEVLLNASCNTTAWSVNATNSTGLSSCSVDNGITPSMPLCIILSAFGGLLEVTSTMFQAYPEHRKKQGK